VRPNLRRKGNRLVGKRWVDTDGGYIKIVLPAAAHSGAYLRYPADVLAEMNDPLAMAMDFWKMARHEWGHILDFQRMAVGVRLNWSRRSGYRLPNWATRPEEIRAIGHCDDADAMGRGAEWAVDEILTLAIAVLENE